MRVLIVDDSVAIRERIAALLVDVPGLELAEAESADEALAVARRWAPRLVLLDLHLPRRSGLAVLPQLKALRPAPAVMVLTGDPTDHHRRFAMAGGADYFFDKAADFIRVVLELARPTGRTP